VRCRWGTWRRWRGEKANHELLATYWQVGRHIVEFEQAGQVRAEYGKALIEQLARDLTLRHGKGFSRSKLIRIRQFYLLYPKGATLSHQLSWSHVVELLKIDDPLERSFYEQQSVSERWSVRELIRQKDSALFLRLQQFLLELGKGFTYVGRQYRILLNNSHYKVDLVFYHRILRCFVLIDLKLGDVQHHDIGQMNLYLGYFANEETSKATTPPIGIILSRHKDELLVEYATYNLNSQLFVQKYQL
jgi:predicted nuclease of restriction endonuclease-like (RecB) superfamily